MARRRAPSSPALPPTRLLELDVVEEVVGVLRVVRLGEPHADDVPALVVAPDVPPRRPEPESRVRLELAVLDVEVFHVRVVQRRQRAVAGAPDAVRRLLPQEELRCATKVPAPMGGKSVRSRSSFQVPSRLQKMARETNLGVLRASMMTPTVSWTDLAASSFVVPSSVGDGYLAGASMSRGWLL